MKGTIAAALASCCLLLASVATAESRQFPRQKPTTTAALHQFPPLSKVLSADNMDGLSATDLEALIAAAAAESRAQAGTALPHLFCTGISGVGGASLFERKTALENSLGFSLKTVFVDKNDDLACYSAVVSHDFLAEKNLLGGGGFLVQAFPSQLKLHRNLLDSILANQTDVKGLELVVQFSDAYQGSGAVSLADRIQAQKDAFLSAYSSALASSTTRFSLGRWSSVAQAEASRGACRAMPAVEGLTVSKSTARVALSTFSAAPKDCLMRLAEALAASPRVGKVAVGARPKVSNFEARGITQSGTLYNEPYSKAGLWGQRQVIRPCQLKFII